LNLKQLIKISIHIVVSMFFIPIKHLTAKKRVVVFQTYSRQLYCDNTRYLFEFISNKKGIDAYWVTDNAKIRRYISNNGWKYITWHKPFEMLKVALSTKIVVDNGTKFFNIFNILSPKSVIKISLQHGCGPKITLRHPKVSISIKQIRDMNAFDYINFPSEYSRLGMGKNLYFLPDEKIVSFGYPRCDQFFDSELVERSFKEKNIAKELAANFTNKDKVILYTPTWRPYPYDPIPLRNMASFDVYDFNRWLKNNNLFFFCTTHSSAGPSDWSIDLDRIILIDKDTFPLFDLNKFMLEVDVLLNDYSTTSTDFSILNRPQVFYMPDYEVYSDRTGFFEEYRNILPGREIFLYEELKQEMKSLCTGEVKHNAAFSDKRTDLLQKYYDKRSGVACNLGYEFIKQKLDGI